MSDQPTETPSRRRRARPAQLDDAAWLKREYVVRGRTTVGIAAELGCDPSMVSRRLGRHGIPARNGGHPYISQLDDAAWLKREYVERRRTTVDIASELGCDPSVVSRRLARHSIPARHDGPPHPPQLDDAAWLKREYVERRRTTCDIAAEVGCSDTSVGVALRRHSISARSPRGVSLYPQLNDAAWLKREYVERGRSQPNIADELGCDPSVVCVALQRHSIPARVAERPSQLDDASWLRREYVERGRTTYDIAAELGCSGAPVGRALARHGIPARNGGHPYIPQLADAAWLKREYVERGRSPADIATELGCNTSTIALARRRHGIATRGCGPRARDPMRLTAIYALVSPDSRIIYVGQSVEIDIRIANHWRRQPDWRALWPGHDVAPRESWAILIVVAAAVAGVEEARHIDTLLTHGETLTNVTRWDPRWDEA